LLWGSGNNYCYTIAEAAKSYDAEKLDRFTRRVLFVKPDHVLILDHVALRNTGTSQRDARWILHFQHQPQPSGELIRSDVPGHVETFDGKEIFQANGKGNVAIKTLLPILTRTTRIGGAGYEFYVDGQNYPVSSNMDTVHTTPGNWRIEVSPTEVHDTLVFFHTIKIGDDQQPAVSGGDGQQNEHTIGVDWDNTLYFFDAKGMDNSETQILKDIPGGRVVNIFVADLDPAATYIVSVDEVDQFSFVTPDTNGILQRQLDLEAGSHTIRINKQTLSVNDMPGLDFRVTAYPNPTDGVLTVHFADPDMKQAQITVFSIEGIKMAEKVAIQDEKLNVAKWPEGTYVLSWSANGKAGSFIFVVN
jgi:hypothetical protein